MTRPARLLLVFLALGVVALGAALAVIAIERRCKIADTRAILEAAVRTLPRGYALRSTNGRLEPRELRDVWGTPIHYRCPGKTDTWELVSFGPNRQDDVGAGDDIVRVGHDESPY